MRMVDEELAKAELSRLIEQTCAGDEIVITRNSRPMVRLLACSSNPGRT